MLILAAGFCLTSGLCFAESATNVMGDVRVQVPKKSKGRGGCEEWLAADSSIFTLTFEGVPDIKLSPLTRQVWFRGQRFMAGPGCYAALEEVLMAYPKVARIEDMYLAAREATGHEVDDEDMSIYVKRTMERLLEWLKERGTSAQGLRRLSDVGFYWMSEDVKTIALGALQVAVDQPWARWDGQTPIYLSAKEHAILVSLMKAGGHVVPYVVLLGNEALSTFSESRDLSFVVKRINEKLLVNGLGRSNSRLSVISVSRGEGYSINAELVMQSAHGAPQ